MNPERITELARETAAKLHEQLVIRTVDGTASVIQSALETLAKELTAELTARETAERERDEAKQEAAARLEQTLGQSRAYEQAIREWKTEVEKLRAKLAALEAQPVPSVAEAAKEIIETLPLSAFVDSKAIESILTRLQSGKVARVKAENEAIRKAADEVSEKAMAIKLDYEELRSQLEASRAECERLDQFINSPGLIDFQKAVILEAAHQRERWGSDHDAGKTPADWFWLVGYVAGKALSKPDKRLHHIITTAAVCANWHAAELGLTDMRPGISADKTEAIDAMQPAPDASPSTDGKTGEGV